MVNPDQRLGISSAQAGNASTARRTI